MKLCNGSRYWIRQHSLPLRRAVVVCVRTLNALAAEAGSADSIAIYYAGHGFSMNKHAPGYWLAADASVTDPKSWISNADIARLLSGIRSKQVTLISDSCYSGAFAREGLGAIGQHAAADDVLAKRSVVVLASGGESRSN